MSGIFFAAAVLVAPWLFLIANACRFKGKHKMKSAILCSIFVYSLILLGAHVEGIKMDQELQAFDLNKDGVFSLDEQNAELQAVMERYSSDTGLAMAPIIGFFLTVIYVSLVYWFWLVGSKLWFHLMLRTSNKSFKTDA